MDELRGMEQSIKNEGRGFELFCTLVTDIQAAFEPLPAGIVNNKTTLYILQEWTKLWLLLYRGVSGEFEKNVASFKNG